MPTWVTSHLLPFSPSLPPPSPPQLLLGSPPSLTSNVSSRRGQSPERNRLGFIWWLPRPEEAAIARNTPTDFVLHSLSPGGPQRTTSRGHGEQRLRVTPSLVGWGFWERRPEEVRGTESRGICWTRAKKRGQAGAEEPCCFRPPMLPCGGCRLGVCQRACPGSVWLVIRPWRKASDGKVDF